MVDRGSFSAVAKELGIGQPAVSKQISALENELGAQLIHRSSRAITLTEAGRDFYASALHILDDFENVTSRIGRGQTAPRTDAKKKTAQGQAPFPMVKLLVPTPKTPI